MIIKKQVMKTQFSPIHPDYYDMFSEEQEKKYSKVFYFGTGSDVEEAKGKITGLVKRDAFDEYLAFDSGDEVRVDRIITVNGRPGPAYDEYDAYALACLNCNVQAD
jgi:hypothetical protein